jgi:hypothetical protein
MAVTAGLITHPEDRATVRRLIVQYLLRGRCPARPMHGATVDVPSSRAMGAG